MGICAPVANRIGPLTKRPAARNYTPMLRSARLSARNRVRHRPVYDTLEGLFSVGSLLPGPVVGGVALPSVRAVEQAGDHRAVDLALERDRVPALPPRSHVIATAGLRPVGTSHFDGPAQSGEHLASPATDRPETDGPSSAQHLAKVLSGDPSTGQPA